MRNTIMMLLLIISLIVSGICLVASNEPTSEEVMVTFLEELLTGTPEKYDEILHENIFGQLDVDTYTINTYGPIATERLMINIVANRTIALTSEVAYKTDANVTLEDLEITRTQTSEDKVYYDFKAVTRVTTIASSESVDYPIIGQIGIKEIDGVYKVDTVRFFTMKILDHLYKYGNLAR